MSRARFGLLLALLVLIVGVASFVVVLSLLDDEPGTSASGELTSTTTSSTAPAPGQLPTPSFVAIVASEGDAAAAQAVAAELTERGYDSGVLRSEDYASLEPGFWVTYVGPFGDDTAAQVTTDELVGDGYSSAYVRCVGTAEECG